MTPCSEPVKDGPLMGLARYQPMCARKNGHLGKHTCEIEEAKRLDELEARIFAAQAAEQEETDA